MLNTTTPLRPPYLSVGLLSASALAYEVLLMRLFSIIQWHHFAYMIIGLALLGYGISGTVISIYKRQLLSNFNQIFMFCLLLFSLTTVGCFLLAQNIPFNAEEILWDPYQILYLLMMFLLLTLPFFLAASAICLSFIRYHMKVPHIYAADLFGAGLGSLTILLLLYWLFPQWALIVVGISGLIAVIVAASELNITFQNSITLGTLVMIGVLIYIGTILELNISPYKSLSQTLRIEGTEIIEERSSPLGYLSVLQSRQIPLRYAPGLSIKAQREPPNQLGIFVDGDSMSAITQWPDMLDKLLYLDQTTSAVPYHLNRINRVLIIGAGGGADVLQARLHNTATIDAIELNPQVVALLNQSHSEFSGHLYQQDNINIIVKEARSFLSKSLTKYDLIQLSLVDAFNASSSGLYALNESYLYTLEAIEQYLNQLSDGGYLAMTRWIKLPPRDSLKLAATAIAALEKRGVASAAKQLVLLRSWQTSTLLIKNGEFSAEELKTLQQFCQERAFDLAYTPTLSMSQTNRFNVLSEPVFFQAVTSMLSDKRETFLQRYKFNLQPATDDRPYFHHFFKWSAIKEIYQLRQAGGMALMEWGYMILIVTLLIATLLSVALIIAPLWFFHRAKLAAPGNIKRSSVFYYFIAIGLAFLFIEIAFIQKFTLFLHHPILTIAVVLTAFLIFSGAGSLYAGHIRNRYSNRLIIIFAVSGISMLCIAYLFLLSPLFVSLAAISGPLKIVFSIVLISPLAFCMGMPFPAALDILGKHADQYVPWAWGINGCASVISAVLATLLAIHFGFSVVVLTAVILYLTIILVNLHPAKPAAQ